MLTTNVIGSTHNANQDFLIHGENYGIVADLYEIIPQIIKYIQEDKDNV